MHFIQHIIEPTKLLLSWQSSDENKRTRYIIAELHRAQENITLRYLPNTTDFNQAEKLGFEFYPAFPDIQKIHDKVLDTFMRRLPPRNRGDFSKYLEELRIKDDSKISDFALLGYSGAKLLSDGFSIIHPFENVDGACELLLEVAGYRFHVPDENSPQIKIDTPVTFSIEECNDVTKAAAVRIMANHHCIGYVNRGLIPTFLDWIENQRVSAWVEKMNETIGRPSVYLYVKVSAAK